LVDAIKVLWPSIIELLFLNKAAMVKCNVCFEVGFHFDKISQDELSLANYSSEGGLRFTIGIRDKEASLKPSRLNQ
jgi:hypothetical protein